MKFLVKFFWLAILIVCPNLSEACDPGFLNIRFNQNQTKIKVELAETFEDRKKGLMFRKDLDPGSGMLFVYGSPRTVNFWMKNTQIPLDIAFADQRGIITRVVKNAVPYSLDLISGGKNIQYVVEVNAGDSTKLNLFEGAQLQHEKFTAEAIWQC